MTLIRRVLRNMQQKARSLRQSTPATNQQCLTVFVLTRTPCRQKRQAVLK
nr:MAG TPA: hypothetical protein [Caudoviricetes sp.]